MELLTKAARSRSYAQLPSSSNIESSFLTSEPVASVNEANGTVEHVNQVHRLMNIHDKRRLKCNWRTANGPCKNVTSNRCVACFNKKGKPLMLCGKHLLEHRNDEINRIIN